MKCCCLVRFWPGSGVRTKTKQKLSHKRAPQRGYGARYTFPSADLPRLRALNKCR
jgi:hypothetical protein